MLSILTDTQKAVVDTITMILHLEHALDYLNPPKGMNKITMEDEDGELYWTKPEVRIMVSYRNLF